MFEYSWVFVSVDCPFGSLIDYRLKMMDLKGHVQSIFLCVLNALLFCAGTFLNLLVIVSFWRSSAYLRSKLCYFMIMVLSFCDFLAVITNHPVLILRLVLWLKEKNDLLAMVQIYEQCSNVFIGFSIMALLVMSVERYLGAYYPFFHRTSLTRRRLLTLLAVLFLLPTIFTIIFVKDMVISYATGLMIFFVIVFPPLLFFNYKLFMISRKVRRDIANRRDNTSSPEISTLHVNIKKNSTCLLSVGCFLLMYFPTFIAIRFTENSKSENAWMALFWTNTMANVNSTLNCLIFFWKNDVLRREGIKAVRVLKRRVNFTC